MSYTIDDECKHEFKTIGGCEDTTSLSKPTIVWKECEKCGYRAIDHLDLEFRQFHIQRHIANVKKIEQELLKKVLVNVLGREPQIDDAKECTKIYQEGELFNYHLAYKGNILGVVTFRMDGYNCSVNFSPNIMPSMLAL